MELNNLISITKRKKKIIGRGMGSGKGFHTVGRGTKGQKSRTGYKAPGKAFEGGQNPLFRRIPKLRGFSRGYFKADALVVTLGDLNKLDEGTVVDRELLAKKGWIGKSKLTNVVILNQGDLSKKLSIKGLKLSNNAKQRILKLGGKVE